MSKIKKLKGIYENISKVYSETFSLGSSFRSVTSRK